MSKPLGISLAGGGRVIVLTPDTVRQAFFHFTRVNQLTAPSVHGFNLPQFRSREANSTAVDRLFRRRSYDDRWYADGSSCRLDPCEIDGVERHMNRLLIDQNARLVDEEGVIRTGAVPARQGKGSRRKVTYVLRYGMIFELTPLNRNALLRGSVRDVMIENADRRIELVRFWGVCMDRREQRILVRLSPRLDLRRVWRLPLERFRTRRLFDVRAAVPFDGFHFVERLPLASGKDRPLGRRVDLDRTDRAEALEPKVANSSDPLCDALFPIDPDPRPVQHVAEKISGQVPSFDSPHRDYFETYLNPFPILGGPDPVSCIAAMFPTLGEEICGEEGEGGDSASLPDDQKPSSPDDAKRSESQDLKSTGLLCRQLVRAGELERAKIMCQEMISQGKHHLGIWLGILLAEQGDQQAAEAAFDACLQRGVPVFMLSFFGASAVVLARTGARAALQKCVELGNLYAAGKLAESLAHESGWASVRAAHGINARFERVDSVHVPGELSMPVSRGEDAKARYLATLARGDFRVASLLNPLLEDESDFEKARAALKSVKMDFPGHILDAVFCGGGDLKKIEYDIWNVEVLGGNVSDAEIYRGVLHANAGNRAKADRAFRNAAFGNTGPQFTLVGLLARAANRRGAKAAFEKAVDLGDAYGALCLGKLLLEAGDEAGAEAAFTVGMDLGNAAAAYRLGVLLGDLGESSRSIDAFQRARKLGYESTLSPLL